MRLERHDPYLKSFTATVAEARTATGGDWLRLDRSAFYPTSGGQPHDTGVLITAGSEARVLDVVIEAGEVWHRLDSSTPLAAVGDVVSGRIDWHRRFTHMQRHTGQHLLSQAFVRVGRRRGGEFATRSVSLRGPTCTLDLSGEPDDEVLAEVEAEADEAARRALPVVAFEVEDTKLGHYRLRRPAKVSGLVRLVAIGDYDLVACGGTHLRSSAEALPIKLLGRERKGELTRVTFRVGAEALADLAVKHTVGAQLSARLSSSVDELPARLDALLEQLALSVRDLATARSDLAAELAGRLLANAESDLLPEVGLVSLVLDEAHAPLYEPVLEVLQGAAGTVSLLACPATDGSVKLAFLAGPGTDIDVRPALTAALEIVGGRGGGRPDRAQGAGPHGGEAESALAAARQLLSA